MGYSKLKIPKNYEHCDKPFEAKTVITRFCSRECGQKSGNAKKKNARKEAKQPKREFLEWHCVFEKSERNCNFAV
jgi:hypothetical protein